MSTEKIRFDIGLVVGKDRQIISSAMICLGMMEELGIKG